VALDDGKEIVEVVRNATREAAKRFHLLRLAELILELLLLGLVGLKNAAGVIEGSCDTSNFIPALSFEREVEVALFEGANSVDETRERPRESIRNHKYKRATRQYRNEAQPEEQTV
jgi:hypothetical protein